MTRMNSQSVVFDPFNLTSTIIKEKLKIKTNIKVLKHQQCEVLKLMRFSLYLHGGLNGKTPKFPQLYNF